MNKPVWVLRELLQAVQQMLIAEHGGFPGIQEQMLLDSALACPQQKAAYQTETYIFELAAYYSFGLANNHPFVD